MSGDEIDAATLRIAADALEAQPPKTRTQYVAVLRLYADEPWRLTTAHPKAHSLADCWCGASHRRRDFL